jgi:hypothetical protein
VLLFSLGWFLIHEHEKLGIPTKQIPQELIEEPSKIDWAPLVPGITSITIFFLRYFLIEKRKKKTSQKTSLLDHLVFDTIEDLLENDIEHRTFGSEGKTEVMRAMIRTQLETYRDSLKDFVINNSSFESQADFRKKLRGCVFDMIDLTEKRWKERNIPQVLIEKYSAFYKQRIDLLLSDILSASFEEPLNENNLKTFLNDARIIFRTGLQEDVVMALASLNGELDGLIYNGKTI